MRSIPHKLRTRPAKVDRVNKPPALELHFTFTIMSSIVNTLGLRSVPGVPTPNHAATLLLVNWFFAYGVMSTRVTKTRLRIDNNVAPREDLATLGEAAVKSGKIDRKALNKLKRQEAAHANAVEGYSFFVAAILTALFAGVPNETINTIGVCALPSHIIPGAQIIPANDKSALKNVGAHHQIYPDRRTVTIRASKNEEDDISSDFLWAIHQANHGGRLLLEKGKTYMIGTKLDLTFLDDIEVQLEGQLKFTNNITYWQANNFYYSFQKSITFWRWGGQDIKIFGKGTLDGNGQKWYDEFSGSQILDPDNTFYRPILFLTENATRVSVEGITQLNSPCWTNFFVRTNDVSFDDVFIHAYSTNASVDAANTDGFDTLNVDGLRVTNTRVDNGDDCFSPKSNTSHIFVQNLWCNNSHGVSMGSIGQYSGVMDFIENAYMENVTLLNGQNGARLKAWAGEDVGYGRITNVTYRNVQIQNTDNPIVLDQCYFDINSTECAKYPSQVNVTNIVFDNIWGTSSGKEGKVIADLTCSPNAVCSNISLSRINVTSPAGSPPEIICDGIQGSIGVNCTSST
ncbi:Glycoside hydrolase family 28 [Penicillium angulare]|uniref:Glycoside hydrolase family 28 n=1 Tax=Penicillium angulare TaxID=116970 RepID=UPI0025400F1C|nr:Glycoside hydrolase family 28 [Penicillium angulare]KAJ5260528.1 Glycoside hydrolase family 28 [Penicillium angulare]